MNVENKLYKIDSIEWDKECATLRSKFNKGTLVIGAIGLILSLIFGKGILFIVLCFCLVQFLVGMKRFQKLKDIGDYSFLITEKGIKQSDGTKEELFLPYTELKNSMEKNWGLELERTDKQENMQIPRAIEDYELIKEYVKLKIKN